MYAVIFRSTRSLEAAPLYSEWAERMEAAVRRIDGYISHFGFRDAQTRQGVTISYFETQESIDQWREAPDHLEAQALGREYFYDDYTVHIARIERGYTWNRSDGYSSELT